MQQHNTKLLSQVQMMPVVQQNERLNSQLTSTKQQLRKMQQKYQKSLKQLALIVKANQTLKKDYDTLDQHLNKVVEQKTEVNKQKMKEYLKKDLDELNKTIEGLNEDKDRMEMENSMLKMKLNVMGHEKSNISKEKEQVQKKYRILQNELYELDPEARDNNTRALAVKELKQKARLVDELQQMIHTLQQEKQSIHKDYQTQLSQIQELWNEWREFQKQIVINGEDKNRLKLSGVEYQQPQERNSHHKKRKRRPSLIYQEGMQVIKKGTGNKKKADNQHKKQQSQQLQTQTNQIQTFNNQIHTQTNQIHTQTNQIQTLTNQIQTLTNQIQTLTNQIRQLEKQIHSLEKQNKNLKSQLVTSQQNQKQVYELQKINQKLTEQKLLAEQKLSELRINNIIHQQTNQPHQKITSNSSPSPFPEQDDLVSILRDLHLQLSPLRQQLIQLKKQYTQQSQTTSTERANFEVKLTRLQKQLQFHKQHNDLLKKQLSEVKSEKQLLNELNHRLQDVENEKSSLEGKLIVLETLNVADRTRVDGQTYSVLKQFEKRIELLVQGGSSIFKEMQGNHLQHLVAMKAYILELDERLKQMAVDNQKLTKKHSYSKQKINQLNLHIKELQSQQTQRICMYKQKLEAYDKLVNKLTQQLEKNINKSNNYHKGNNHHKNNNHEGNNGNHSLSRFTTQMRYLPNSHFSQEQQYHQVINLYEEKMINMGEEIVRIKGDKDQLEDEVKQLRFQLNSRIRELNDKERDLVRVKTDNISLTNTKNSLEREFIELKALHDFYLQNNNEGELLEKSRFITILQHQNNQIRNNYLQENQRIKQVYETQITELRDNIQQLQIQLSNKEHKQKRQPKQRSVQKDQSEIINNQVQLDKSKEQVVRKKEWEIKKIKEEIKQDYEKQQIASVELAIQKHQQITQQLTQQHQSIIAQRDRTIQKLSQSINQLQNQLTSLNQSLKNLQKKKLSLQQLSRSKDRQINQLQEVILKNNKEMTRLRMERKHAQYSSIESQDLRTESTHELMDENTRLNSDIFELNVKISGLEATKYNLKLENQILRGDCEFMQDKLHSLQNDLKLKNSRIFHLQNDVTNYSTSHDSTLMAKDSLIRSYENEIRNLKSALEDLKGIGQIERHQQQSRIRHLENKLFKENQFSDLTVDLADLKVDNTMVVDKTMQNVNHSNNQPSSFSNQSSQQLMRQQIMKQQLLFTLNQKITTLQSQLKYTQQKLLHSSQQLSRLNYHQNNSSSNIPLQQSSSNISVGWEEEVNELKGQVLNLRRDIVGLKTEIQFKEQEIQMHKQEVYRLRLGRKDGAKIQDDLFITGKTNQDNQHNENNHKQQINIKQTTDQKNSPCKSPIHIIANQPSPSYQPELTQLQLENKQLLINQTHQNQTISLLNNQIHHLNNQILLLTQQLHHYKQAESTINRSILTELQKLKQRQNLTENQKCQLLAQDIEKMESAIYEIKNEYELDLNQLRHTIKLLENDLIAKDLKISELMRTMVQTRMAMSEANANLNHANNSQSHEFQSEQQFPDVTYLIQQIQRQSHLLTTKQRQLSQSNTLLTKLQSEKNRSRQNLPLIVLLIVEIQSLRNQLQQIQSKTKLNHSQNIESNKMSRNVSRQLRQQEDEKQKVDFSLIKILQCSHEHLVNYEKMLVERRLTNEGKRGNQEKGKRENSERGNSLNSGKLIESGQGYRSQSEVIGDPQTLTIINSSKGIIEQKSQEDSLPSHTQMSPNYQRATIQKQKILHLSKESPAQIQTYRNIGSIKSSQVISFPSESHNSSISNLDSNYNYNLDSNYNYHLDNNNSNLQSNYNRNLQSNYSLKNPLRNYYRHAESTYSPMMFSPPTNKPQIESPEEKKHLKTALNPMTFGSFGKISQSHNVESSYGSSSSSSYLMNNDVVNGYSYTLKNVNMIQSVGEGDNRGQNGLSHASIGNTNNFTQPYYSMTKDPLVKLHNQYSFGKPKQFTTNSQSSLAPDIQSRYIVEKQNTTNFSPSDSLLSRNFTTNQNTSTSTSFIPLSTEINPIKLSANLSIGIGSRQSYPYGDFSKSNTSQIQKSDSNSSRVPSNAYLPTYNNNSKQISYLSSKNLYDTKFISTLGDTSSTQQQKFKNKF